MADKIHDTLIQLRKGSTKLPDSPTFGDYVMLWGYLFENPYSAKSWWLYLSLNFDEYIEFAEDSKGLKKVDLFSDVHPLAGTLVWIQKDATVRRVREETAQQESDFLKGKIARGFLSGSGASSLVGFAGSVNGQADPGSGGGCGSGSPSAVCE